MSSSSFRAPENLAENSEFYLSFNFIHGDSFNNSTPVKVSGKKWETYFRRLYQNNNTNTTLPEVGQNRFPDNQELNSPLTIEELDRAIDKLLKNGKAARNSKKAPTKCNPNTTLETVTCSGFQVKSAPIGELCGQE